MGDVCVSLRVTTYHIKDVHMRVIEYDGCELCICIMPHPLLSWRMTFLPLYGLHGMAQGQANCPPDPDSERAQGRDSGTAKATGPQSPTQCTQDTHRRTITRRLRR
jgi:hypothetical protein